MIWGETKTTSSYRGSNYSKCMTEIQGKSILVRVSARFELARVRVIGSRLYLLILEMVILLIISYPDLTLFYTEKWAVGDLGTRLYCWKSRGETFFSTRHWLGGSKCCIFEMKRMKHVTGMETCTKMYFLFIFTIWWRHCENHLCTIFRSLNQFNTLRYACCGGVASAHGSHSWNHARRWESKLY